MKNYVVEYFEKECYNGCTVAKKSYALLEPHSDILGEFESWVLTREYKSKDEGALKIQGYTAQDIYNNAPYLEGVYVFKLLVNLRENPKETLKLVKLRFGDKI